MTVYIKQRSRLRVRELLLAFSALVAMAMPAAAQDATWSPTAATGNFNSATNWTAFSVPGPPSTAFFGTETSGATSLSFSAPTFIGGFTFNTGASNYSFLLNNVVNFTGAGIVINGGSASFTINAGMVFNNSSSAGSSNITNNNNLQFVNTSTAGNATITNTGVVWLADQSTAGNATITNGGTFRFQTASSGGNAAITNNNTLRFEDNSTAGSARIANNGALDLVNGGTAGNATITNNFTIRLLDSSTAGNATITNNHLLQFFDSSTGGTARLINNAGGNIDLSVHTGSTSMAVGSIEGIGTISLGSTNLTVGGNNLFTTYSGAISDSGGIIPGHGGALTKVGTGTLILSGTDSYTGATTINGGTLQVDGTITNTSSVDVNSGGTLAGIGNVDPLTVSINSGGTLAPGNGTPGTSLMITGNLAFASGALYLVALNSSIASFANVTGSATLAGNVMAAFAPGSVATKQYDILHAAGGLSGTFAGVTSNLAGLVGNLSYTATDVFLSFHAQAGFGSNLNVNQQNVANVVNTAFNGGGALPAGFLTLLGLSGANLGNALTQASGETAVGSQQTTFEAMNLFMGLLTDPFIDGRGGATTANGTNGYADQQALGFAQRRDPNNALAAIATKAPVRVAPFEQRWSVWASGFGGSQTTSGNTTLGSNDTTSRVFGTAVGADYRFSPSTIAGFALAGGGTHFSVANGGTGRSDLFQAGAYVRHNAGPAYVTGALAYGWQDITTDRTLAIAGIDRLRAEFNANAFSGRLEGGYRFVTPWSSGIGITPYAAAQFTTFDLPAYAEGVVSGANTFALSYNTKSATATRSELGFRTDKSFTMPDSIVTLRGRAAWAHDYDTDRNIAATFQTLPGASFIVNGAAPAPDAALISASAERKWLNGFSLAATFEGEFSDVTRSYAGKGVVRYQW
jgi:autotransporter-associated beta strand protein